jgi:hypothetical protein
LNLLMKHLMLYSTGGQKGNTKVHVREVKSPPLLDPKLSPKIVSLLKLAAEREKEAKAMQCLK